MKKINIFDYLFGLFGGIGLATLVVSLSVIGNMLLSVASGVVVLASIYILFRYGVEKKTNTGNVTKKG